MSRRLFSAIECYKETEREIEQCREIPVDRGGVGVEDWRERGGGKEGGISL